MKMLVIALGGTLLAVSATEAATISVDFAGTSTKLLTADEVAGVAPHAVANWNVVSGQNTGSSNPALPLTLKDETGSTSAGVKLSAFNSQAAYALSTPASPTPDQKIFGGLLLAYYTNGVNFTLTNIPFASYDLIVYIEADTTGRQGSVSTSNSATQYYYSTFGTTNQPTAYTQITSTTPGTYSTGNYVVFSDLNTASVTVSANQNTNQWAGVTAFQIVSTPEPASLSMLALAGLALGRRRRA